jgi:drug/metabolite transporter (DMT)-like permease
MAIALAIASAFFNALSNIISGIGLRHYQPFSAVVINVLSMVGGAVLISLFTASPDQFLNKAAIYFAISGLMGPLISRFFLFIGIQRIGASISLPIHSTRSLYGVIGAVIILGESLTPPVILGIILIIIGLATISLEESGGKIEKNWSKKNLVFPIMAAILLGSAHVIRKIGLNIMPNPIVGVTVQNTAALVFLPLLGLTQQRGQRVVLNEFKAWIIFGSSGLTMLISQLCLYYALELGRVTIISPLVSITPLFGLVMVPLFLRKLERLTWKIVMGALIIVGGTSILTLR